MGSIAVNTAAVRRRGKLVFLLGLDIAAAMTGLFVAPLLFLPQVPYEQFAGAALKGGGLVAVAAAAIFYFAGLSRRFWRFVSIADLAIILGAAGLLSLFSFAAFSVLAPEAGLPPLLFAAQGAIAMTLMGCMRIARRFGPKVLQIAKSLAQGGAAAPAPAALIAGAPDCVDGLLRQLDSGVMNGFRPIGVLDETEFDIRRQLRGVPILGGLEMMHRVVNDLRGRTNEPQMLVIAACDNAVADPRYVRLASDATGLGLKVVRASLANRLDNARFELRDYDLSQLLGRPPARFDPAIVSRAIRERCILVTGAGGSIGSELVRQIASFLPAKIILVELSEYNLYAIDHEVRRNFPETEIVPLLCDIRDRKAVMSVFAQHHPDLVFHAAALKHVPLVELNACSGAATNILGTRNIADAARKHRAAAMVQVSTDKAVNPVGVMGATKRLAELYCQALDLQGANDPSAPRFMTVRFGNVLDSSGSVVPLFRRQLRERMPLTVTHPEMTRYFMTIHEAVSLVLQSAQSALEGHSRRGRIFVLDMGDPIKIVDIATRMIRLSGLQPDVDVKIEFIGTRPGEKLFEELFDSAEEQLESTVPGVFEAEPLSIDLNVLDRVLERLSSAVDQGDEKAVKRELFALIAGGATNEKADRTVPLQSVADGQRFAEEPRIRMGAAQ